MKRGGGGGRREGCEGERYQDAGGGMTWVFQGCKGPEDVEKKTGGCQRMGERLASRL